MLHVLRLGDPRRGPHVVITAGVHGDEFMPMAAVRDLAARLDGATLRGCVTLVPVVNEPAFRLGRRAGPDGLDLARVCPGRADGSVTEQIAHELAALIRTADAYMDLHSGGVALEIEPLCGYMLHPDPLVLEAQRRMAELFPAAVVWGTDPSLPGRSLSVARDALVPAVYAELGGGISSALGDTSSYLAGCLNILADLGVVDGPVVEPAGARVVVEDDRPGSGHMQAQHPAPIAGHFRAAAPLGATLRRGDLLGTIEDLLGRTKIAVPAVRDGRLIVSRTLPLVNEGDCLGVILETDRPA